MPVADVGPASVSVPTIALCDDAGGRSRDELHERFAHIVVDAFERDLLAE